LKCNITKTIFTSKTFTVGTKNAIAYNLVAAITSLHRIKTETWSKIVVT
jgi:hypothetical protein